MRAWQLSKLDMYRKVPINLVEGSRRGSIISLLAILLIVCLFCEETADFCTTKLLSQLTLDQRQSGNDLIKVSFNITMMDLKCDYVEVDVVSVLGNKQNATKYFKKIPLDGKGVLNAMVRISRLKQEKYTREGEDRKHAKGEVLVVSD